MSVKKVKHRSGILKFDISVKSQDTTWNTEYSKIRTRTELTIQSDEYRKQYEASDVELCNTMRQVLYMFYMSVGVVTQIGDDEFIKMYEKLNERKEILSVTVQIEECETIEHGSHGKHKKDVHCDVILNLKDDIERSDLFAVEM